MVKYREISNQVYQGHKTMTIEEYKELIKNDKLKIGLDVAEDEDENNQECDT